MAKLDDVNFGEKVRDMLDDFAGIEDSDAICNIEFDGRIVQVKISLIDEDEGNFNDWKGIPTYEID